MQKEEIEIRTYLPEDEAFVYSTWLRHYFTNSEFTKQIPKQLFFEFHAQAVQRIMRRKTVNILVACLKDEPSVILGYLVYEFYDPDYIVHWVFTKNAFRQMGIAKLLANETKILSRKVVYTHHTHDMRWLQPLLRKAIYNPYLI